MAVEIITKEDLQDFKRQLLEEIREIIAAGVQTENKRWLRSNEVKKLLKVSSGTLQNFRINGTLHPVRLSNSKLWYYDAQEIHTMLNSKT